MTYQYITNPVTRRKVKITGKRGKQILENYLSLLKFGGASFVNNKEKDEPTILEQIGILDEYNLHRFKILYYKSIPNSNSREKAAMLLPKAGLDRTLIQKARIQLSEYMKCPFASNKSEVSLAKDKATKGQLKLRFINYHGSLTQSNLSSREENKINELNMNFGKYKTQPWNKSRTGNDLIEFYINKGLNVLQHPEDTIIVNNTRQGLIATSKSEYTKFGRVYTHTNGNYTSRRIFNTSNNLHSSLFKEITNKVTNNNLRTPTIDILERRDSPNSIEEIIKQQIDILPKKPIMSPQDVTNRKRDIMFKFWREEGHEVPEGQKERIDYVDNYLRTESGMQKCQQLMQFHAAEEELLWQWRIHPQNKGVINQSFKLSSKKEPLLSNQFNSIINGHKIHYGNSGVSILNEDGDLENIFTFEYSYKGDNWKTKPNLIETDIKFKNNLTLLEIIYLDRLHHGREGDIFVYFINSCRIADKITDMEKLNKLRTLSKPFVSTAAQKKRSDTITKIKNPELYEKMYL